MPISSIQYRASTENYQNQTRLTKGRQIKISKSGDSTIRKIAEEMLEVKNLPIVFQPNNCKQITIRKDNTTKISLLLLILLNQVYPAGSNSFVGINDSGNPSVQCDPDLNCNPLFSDRLIAKPISWTDEIIRIPQNIANSFMAYDPLRFPMADAAPTPEPLPTHKNIFFITDPNKNYSPDHLIRRENKKLSLFLKKQHLLDKNKKGKVRKEELISAVFSYCSTKDFRDSRRIARKILSASRSYESEKHEFLSKRQAERVIRNWVFKNILNGSSSEYLAKIISKDTDRSNYTINDLIDLLSLENLEAEQIVNFHGFSVEMRSHFKKMWHNYIIKEMPFLHFYDEDENIGMIVLNDLEFSNLYAGARYLSELNSLNHFNRIEASEIGKKMWEQAISEGTSMSMQSYFLTPSLFFVAQNEPKKISDSENIQEISETVILEQLEYRKTNHQVYTAITHKIDSYEGAVRKLIRKEKIGDETEYRELTTEVLDRFSELDEYLILSALNSLGEDETNFIFSLDANIRLVTLNMKTKNLAPVIIPFVGVGCPGSHFTSTWCTKPYSIWVGLDKTDLFSVYIEDEERIYALKNTSKEYILFRVDSNISQYINADILDYKEIKNGYSIDGNKIITEKRTFYFNLYPSKNLIKARGESVGKFIDFLSNKHRNNLFISLYQENYNPSNSQEKWNFIKHFIPFYDCAESLINKNSKEAVVSCLLDTVILTPVIGESVDITEKFAFNLIKGLRRNGLSLSKGSIKSAATTVLKEINLQTINELSSLKKNTLRNFDPGFELLDGISKKYAERVISYLNKDRKTLPLSEKLQSISVTKKLPYFSDPYMIARLPDSEIRVPVRKIDQKEGQDIYAIINPDTGESAWARFIIRENKLVSLDSLPEASVSKALHKIITSDMYATNINIDNLSAPDYMGLRWDDAHKYAYLRVEKKFIKIKILNNQPFLISRNDRIPLMFKNNELKPEGLRHRLRRLQKEGLSGKNYEPKQVIANKLNISEEQAYEILNKYEFTGTSYYSDKTFALWIKETGQIPEWSEAFKILDRINYSSRFKDINIQDNALYSFSGGEGFAYRVDKSPPNIVLQKGFAPSEDYTAIEKMIPENNPGLIVSGDITGALRYNTLAKSPYIYKINLENSYGVSLKENLMKNQKGLKSFFGENIDEIYKTMESVAVDSNGAIYLDEMHLSISDIKIEDISLVTQEEIEQAQPLSIGVWKNYL